jgi:hypothetical protein
MFWITDVDARPVSGDPLRMDVVIHGIEIDDTEIRQAIVDGLLAAYSERSLGDDRRPEDCE